MSTDNETKGALGAAYWDDLRAPAVGINPPGAVADPDRDDTTGWLLFDASATEVCYVQYQMPHGWIEGSEVSFHVHWHKSDVSPMGGTVAWRMRYRWANIGGVWSGWSGAETATDPVVSDDNTAERQALTAFTTISVPTGRISMNLLIELARVGGEDTFGGDAVLTDCDLHIQINQPGSVQLYRKYRNELLPYA